MYLSRIELRDETARTPEFWKYSASMNDVHEVVWSWFADDPDRRRDFLYRHEGEGLSTRFYTLSARLPVDPGGLWRVESKPFAPKLSAGDRLIFSLRANPTRRKTDGPGKGKRHDVVMDAKFAARTSGGERKPFTELVETTCIDWLSSRAAACGFGFAEGDVRTDGYRPVRFPRGRRHADASVTTVDFEGRITVKDPSCFLESVTQGIGPAKAFGCGLMLIRRA
ncbi:MAG TPA: type I-E CRISPR-associated protein Cas6/Cse3/CasE [Thermoanaerobaculia bacterium]|nr:type I-E CRISPR-associated protein Cas6/Cse3/CasE [Thermoanaerobaculia bacterium]